MVSIFLQITVSLVYILSGLLKLQDPVGTGLIVEAYFRFMHLNDFMELAKSFGAMLGFVETTIGLLVFFCLWLCNALRCVFKKCMFITFL